MNELSPLVPHENLRVMITAGAAGIGRVIAETFLAHGARVRVCDISEDTCRAYAAAHPGSSATRANVGDFDDVRRLFDEIEADWGGLDVLVNNAGIAGPTAGVEDIEPAQWRETVEVNLNGQFYCAKLATPMLRASRGVMINISSVVARLGYAYRTPYVATKAAVIGFTQSLAKELGPSGVRVNAILPGVVRGPRLESAIARRAADEGVAYETIEADYLQKISLRRMIEPSDVAHMALYLCTPAGANITGQALSVCGNVETL